MRATRIVVGFGKRDVCFWTEPGNGWFGCWFDSGMLYAWFKVGGFTDEHGGKEWVDPGTTFSFAVPHVIMVEWCEGETRDENGDTNCKREREDSYEDGSVEEKEVGCW